MSQEYVRVLEAAGLTEAANIIAAMDAGKNEPATEAEAAESPSSEPQYSSPEERDGAAMLDAMRRQFGANRWSAGGSMLDRGDYR